MSNDNFGIKSVLGEQITTQKGYAFKSPWYSDAGTPIVKVSDFTDSSIDTYNLTYIPDDIAFDYLKYRLETGDTIIQTVGSWPSNPKSVVGKVIKVPPEVSGALLNQNAVKIIPNKTLDRKYIFYLLKSDTFKDFIINCAQGAASQASITLKDIKNYPFLLPPLPTQHKIVAILSAYDDLIENNTRRIKILEEMAQALYREWFVKFRFPGHEKVKMVESELGMVPEGWEVKKLEDVCLRITDGSHWSPKTVDDGYPMASVKDMDDWGFEFSHCRKIEKEDYEKLIRNDCKPLEGDILIAKDGSYLKHIFVTEKEHELVILSSIAIIRPNNQILPYVLSFYLREPSIKARMAGYVSGVAIPRIVLKDFRKFLIIVPSIDIQSQFFNLAEPMIGNCYRIIEKNVNLRRTRDLLLPKLISGEINVEDLKINV
ncbi:MAG: restriction endonuclease subunit S [Methanosarcinales archaeon]|nr:restriction endonuclease subunit S [Methanosarcinales archaeon]